jgi:ADP-ribose pyrophosphatase
MPDDNPRLQWQGPSWRLWVHTLRRDDGRYVEKGIIEHPGAVVLIPLQDDGTVYMLRQYRLALDETILELPAGTRGWEEPWLACAQRELREETGYRAASLTPLGSVWPAPGYSDEQLRFYLARELSRDPLQPDFDEIIDLQPLSLPRLEVMAHAGQLQDAKSIVGILRAAIYLRNHSSSS